MARDREGIFVSAKAAVLAFGSAPAIELARFRRDIDAVVDQSGVPHC
jgi:hypothetical protein